MPSERRVFTLEDLAEWDATGVWLAVLGHPIGHSLSPAMHNAALDQLRWRFPEYAGWRYVAFDVPPERLREALPLLHARGFYGLNLTVPHKVQAYPWMEEVDLDASRMGAVNTLVATETGYRGFNTDGHGLRTALYVEFGVLAREWEVVLLGAGGAARAAAAQLLRDGCPRLWVGNRGEERLRELLAGLPQGESGERPGEERVRGFLLGEPPDDLPPRALVINATAAGMGGAGGEGGEPPVDPARFGAGSLFFDMVYNPAETPFLRAAREAGHRTANGLSMLVNQGARSLEIWTQQAVSVAVMEEAAREELARQEAAKKQSTPGG